MKKLAAIILVLVMLASAISLAACNTVVPEPEEEKITTKKIYENMVANTGNLDAYEAKIEATVEAVVDGYEEVVNSSMKYNIKVDGLKTESPIGYSNIQLGMFGQTVEVTAYTEGGYIYASAMGENIKVSQDHELASNYNASKIMNGYEIDVPETMLATTEYTVDADGNYVLTFAFNNEHLSLLDGFVNNILSGLEVSLSDVDVSLGEAKYTLTVDKTFMPKNLKLDMVMTVTAEDSSMETDVSVFCEYVAFGDSVTITPPEGYKSFPDFEE